MIDISSEVNVIERTVGTRQFGPGEARTVTISRVYRAAIDEVWDACTNPERIPRWFLPISGELRMGGRYQLEGQAGGRIEKCDPPRSFDATWEFGGDVSWIEVRLTPDGEGRTRFTLEHIAHVDDARWLQYGPGAVGVGWDLTIFGLAQYLEAGWSHTPQEAAAWAASDEGKQFVIESSQQWRDASVKAGTNSEEAHAAAERTTNFYTGVEG